MSWTRLPKDDAKLLEMIKALAPEDQAQNVGRLLIHHDRFHAVEEALRQGILEPTMKVWWKSDGSQARLVNVAASAGALALVRYLLLELQMDPNPVEGDEMGGALHHALGAEEERVALFLIREVPGVNLDARVTEERCTALMIAAAEGLVGAMRAMVEKGADVEAVDAGSLSALVYAMQEKQVAAGLYLLEEAGASWQDPQRHQKSVLCMAAMHGVPALLKPILRRMRADGVEEDELPLELDTAACSTFLGKQMGNSSLASLKELVDMGLDVTQADYPLSLEEGEGEDVGAVVFFHLLHMAMQEDEQDSAAFLLDHGCDPFQPDGCGRMPHHWAAARGHLSLLQWFVARCSIPIDTESKEPRPGRTALYYAVMQGRMATAQWLIGAGADPLRVFPSDLGRPRDVALRHGHFEVAAYLHQFEQAAEAAARLVQEEEQAEQDAAARKARNEKRRQKQKKAKARRQQQQQGAEEAEAGGPSGGGGGGVELLAAGVAGLAVEEQEEEEQEEDKKLPAPPTPEAPAAPAAAPAATTAAPPIPSVERPPPLAEYLDAHAPDDYLCPITLSLLEKPVVFAGDGFTYSRAAIQQHLDYCHDRKKPATSPKTGAEVPAAQTVLVENHLVRGFVREYKEAKTQEWQELERRWLAWQQGQGQQGQQG